MRTETIKGWIFAGVGLVAIAMLLLMAQITEDNDFARFLAAMGGIYFGIGVILAVTHDRHMVKRTQAGRE